MRAVKRTSTSPTPRTVEFDLPFLPPRDAMALLETVEQLHAILHRVYGGVIDDYERFRQREQDLKDDLADRDSDLPF